MIGVLKLENNFFRFIDGSLLFDLFTLYMCESVSFAFS